MMISEVFLASPLATADNWTRTTDANAAGKTLAGLASSIIFVTKIKTRTGIIGRRFQRTRTRIIVIQKTKTK